MECVQQAPKAAKTMDGLIRRNSTDEMSNSGHGPVFMGAKSQTGREATDENKEGAKNVLVDLGLIGQINGTKKKVSQGICGQTKETHKYS